jgi:GNAT superfamily N-acetyltransferase
MSPFIPQGWTATDVERELIDSPTHAYAPFDGLEVIERPGWVQLTCDRFPKGGFNGISRSMLSAEEADRVIDETIAGYTRRGLAFRWSVMPGSTPADLSARLASRGLVATEVVGMSRSTTFEGKPDPGVRVEEAGETEAYARVMAEGWGGPVEALLDYQRACLADPRRSQRQFLASVDGEPAGVAAAAIFPRSLFLLGGVVLPRFRRRGVHRALTAARLALARELGIPLVTTHAIASTSAPLLERQGFDAWFRFPSFSPA